MAANKRFGRANVQSLPSARPDRSGLDGSMRGGVAMRKTVLIALSFSVLAAGASCGAEGPPGPPGPQGPAGDPGGSGAAGTNGANGADGANVTDPSDAGVVDASLPPPKDGTRVKARKSTVTTTTTTSDGAETVTSYQLSGWFDTSRNEPCTFTMAADDKTRCLPTTLAVRDYSNGSYFNDASCTQPLAFTSKPSTSSCGPTTVPGPPSPKYMLFSKTGSSCGGSGIRLLGTPVVPGANIYLKSGANCFGTSPSGSYDYYTVTSEISPTEFVESSTTTVITN
ncbi:MAG: hypothetical protein KIT84_00455 [Labilithrix sp.]|nr:hypothetical protein [Labilithrix sp.]MCW5809454.1 hypothetical protein [Labilithrix sp.]